MFAQKFPNKMFNPRRIFVAAVILGEQRETRNLEAESWISISLSHPGEGISGHGRREEYPPFLPPR
jgi:hypothetical protein